MNGFLTSVLLATGCLFAGLFGFIFFEIVAKRSNASNRHELIKKSAGTLTQQEVSKILLESRGFFEQTILFVLKISSHPDKKLKSPISKTVWGLRLSNWEQLVQKAGLKEAITKDGIVYSRMVFSLGFGLAGLLLGWMFSEILGFLLLIVGFLFGYTQIIRAIKEESKERVYVAEKQLSEMLEVIVLGLRSGLSFDRSLEFYCTQFGGSLSRLLSSAHYQWNFGLITRSEGLRNVARSYDSPLFERTFESIIRSLRFGTSLSESLSISSAEARAIRKAKLEERVAKAPVKMLLPVGTLILPAMLMLVVGPILLDLMNGF